jgi:hypothetical protein
MQIRVDQSTDARGALVPRCLNFDGRRIEIRETIDQWYGPDYRYLKVRGDDQGLYILRLDEPHGGWTLIMYQRAQKQTVKA